MPVVIILLILLPDMKIITKRFMSIYRIIFFCYCYLSLLLLYIGIIVMKRVPTVYGG